MKSKADRVKLFLEKLNFAAPATTGLLAYKLICQTINQIEDGVFGHDYWKPPRSFLTEPTTDRLYPSSYDSMFPVSGWPDVTMIIHIRELIFISSSGAIQIQKKVEVDTPYCDRYGKILLDKQAADGSRVWDVSTNRDI